MIVGIISDAHHYRDADGRLAALAPVVRQFEQWAVLFEEVVVCAPLIAGPPPTTHIAYARGNIRLIPVRRAGGDGIVAKSLLVARIPEWSRSIRKLLGSVDAVHIRCPNNISIVGLVLVAATRKLAQAIYTGNWRGYSGEPLTYRLQRAWLRHLFRGPVAVYDSSPRNRHCIPTFSPAFSDGDWISESPNVERRLGRLANRVSLPSVNLLSVGTLDRNKNQQFVIRLVAQLAATQVNALGRIAGDGPERARLAALASELNVAHRITFMGRLGGERLKDCYRWADFVIQPSWTEGFSKVPLEAMLHGAIPVVSDLPGNAMRSGHGRRAIVVEPSAVSRAAEHIRRLARNAPAMSQMIVEGRRHSRSFTLEAWRTHLRAMLQQHWAIFQSKVAAHHHERTTI